MREPRTPEHPSGGFSLVELLVVVGIIAVLAAISLPAISNYLRHYKIKGAAQQVAGEIQAARNKAINKNVNLGVVFLTENATTYRWVVEDDQDPTDADGLRTARAPVSTLVAAPLEAKQAGPRRVLPIGVEFAQTCSDVPTGGDWDPGMRFDRLGGSCNPESTSTTCPDLGVGQDLVHNGGLTSGSTEGAYICLAQQGTNLTRWIRIRPGGRVLVQP